MNFFLFFIIIFIVKKSTNGESNNVFANTTQTADLMDTTTSPPPGQTGRSFFLFGGFFRKFRQRWYGQHDPVPLYAGPAFPIAGYYNCPIYGCDPTLTYRPAPYEPSNYYNRPPYQYDPIPQPYRSPTQQHTQQSNVVIYQNGQQQQQQHRQPDYYNQNYRPQVNIQQPYPIPAGDTQYYPTVQSLPPPLPPLPPPPPPPPLPLPLTPQPLHYPSIQGGQNYPPSNGVYHQNIPQYPVNNYGDYPPTGAMPIAPSAPQNFDPIYNQQSIPPTGPLPAYPAPIGPPPCPPHVYACQAGG